MVSISSKNYSCDMGYIGFINFRMLVAEKVSDEVGAHYKGLNKAICLYGEGSEEFFKKYNKKTEDLIKDGKLSEEIANFLYQPDVGGEIDNEQAKAIYELIKECDGSISYGYARRDNCAKMSDLIDIFGDGSVVEWC